jgi:hypothetical protein
MTTDTPSATQQEIADAAAIAQASGEAVALPPIKVAFIIDNQLVDVLHTDERLAAIFLSEPTILDVSDIYDEKNPIPVNSIYDPTTGTFSDPGITQPTS